MLVVFRGTVLIGINLDFAGASSEFHPALADSAPPLLLH